MSPIRPTPRALAALTACLFAAGLWQIGEGSWVYAKAGLAQHLLQRAWSRTMAGESNVKPWPWADTWPVARLMVPRLGVDQIVLEGAYGRTLAFAPGRVESSAFSGSPGTTILTGHRDTHFAFLKNLELGDRLTLQTGNGRLLSFLILERIIVDHRTASIPIRQGEPWLVLVTCYPFDTPIPGGPLRFVVTAEAEEF
jgi:sortase A